MSVPNQSREGSEGGHSQVKSGLSQMIFKESVVRSFDRSGVGDAKTIHMYKKGFQRPIRNGNYLKASVKTLSRLPPRIRGRRFRPIRRGFVIRAFIAKATFQRHLALSMFIKIFRNGAILIKRRGQLRSKHLLGLVSRPRRSRRFLLNFNKLVLRCWFRTKKITQIFMPKDTYVVLGPTQLVASG